MTKTRRTRPVLATVISLWEVFIVVMAIAWRIAVRVLHYPDETPHPAHHFVPSSSLHLPGVALGYVLAIAGAVMLWQMRRSAYTLLAARAVLELALPILAPSAHTVDTDSLVPVFVFIFHIIAFALNAAIAWYAYRITKPKRRRHRRHRSHRSDHVPEVEPGQQASPRPTPATRDAPLTTSQFYLSPDHEKTVRKD